MDEAPPGEKDFIEARDQNDDNTTYTMADAVFSACFLNMLLRNADAVGMANFAPTVNTRGMIFTHEKGIVLRPTYHVFELYTQLMGDEVVDSFCRETPVMQAADRFGNKHVFEQVDVVATRDSETRKPAVSLVNKHPAEMAEVTLSGFPRERNTTLRVLSGPGPDAFNDIGKTQVMVATRNDLLTYNGTDLQISLPPCSVSVLTVL